MKYLLIQLITLIVTVILLYYISTLPYFYPETIDGEPNWYNIFYGLLLLFLVLESFISIAIYLVQKFTIYGRKEFPDKNFSIKWGLIISSLIIVLLLLNIFHILNITFGILIVVVVIIVALFL